MTTPASAAAGPRGLLGSATGAVARWWTAPVPLARVAVLRAALYLFVVYDMFFLVNDVVPHGYAPEFYQPLFVPRILELPAPTPGFVRTLQVVLLISTLVAASGRLPRLAGWVVAACYLEWVYVGMSYGKVDHDHLALAVALLVLPTVGRAGFTDRTPSEAAGWAVRCIQVATIATYFLSAVTKINRSGWGWASSAVFTWAIMRRGSDAGRLLLEYPALLRASQWGLLAVEFLSPVVLFLRGRLLLLAALFFVGFHVMTYLAIGIHFLPTVVCWLAFAPLEKLVPRRTHGSPPARLTEAVGARR